MANYLVDNLDQYRDDSGKLVDVGLGCYIQFYVCNNGDVLCADCAQKSIDSAKECGYDCGDLPVTAGSTADTDDSITCDNCDRVLSTGNENDEITL